MADNIYDLIMSASEPSAQEKAARMAQMLRREQTAGQLMQMHPLLRQMGSSILQGSNQGQNRLAGAADTRFGGQLRTNLQDDQQAFMGGENDKDRAERARQGALNRGLQRALAKERAKRAAAAGGASSGGAGGGPAPDPLGVPGFVRVPDAPGIKKEEAAAMRSTLEAITALEPAIKEMETAKTNTGREVTLFGMGKGPDYVAQTAPYAKMVLGIKELAHSGALDEQSERVAQGMVPTPSDSKDAADKKIESLRSYLKERIDAKAKALGYARADEQSQRTTNTGGGGETVMVVPPGGSAPVPVHRSKLDQALAAGGRLVSGG